MESSKRRSYTREQREAVLAEVRAIGVQAASKKHDVPQSCVSRWANAAGVKRAGGETPVETAMTAPIETPSPGVPVPADVAPSAVATPVAKRTLRSRVAKIYSPSPTAMVLEDAAKDGVTAAAKKHGISRFSIYDWRRRLTKAAAGEGPSPTSGPAPRDIEQRAKGRTRGDKARSARSERASPRLRALLSFDERFERVANLPERRRRALRERVVEVAFFAPRKREQRSNRA
jgi:hypothetical protein